jgi:hypothetical protein
LQLISRVFRFACHQKLELSKQSKVRNYDMPLPFLNVNKLCTLNNRCKGEEGFRRVFLLFTAWGFRSCNGERFRV